ncbi:fungal specific transcription factor domain containing protein [Ophiostoma piceae UAMH 11346]|uniref:Fungal specific transcription factor domain containing protein n=1 Tax=Ophiostoma piceae (strain UAMH 11346) TaxID=1262450 RepID=S3BRQ5_OPHP1|nr:fungal specific transcription factor domain containing protein [Ophiostoma piceae UAMH 11346]
MAPRPAARCCRAVRSHLAHSSAATTAYSDGVWITDLVLATAFVRYCHIAPARTTSPPRALASKSLQPPLSNTAATPATIAPRTTRRRFSGHVPGPLEARRRLGKRQMTEQLSLQLSLSGGGPPLPVWALPSAPDLRQWQWTPPRDAALFTRNNTDSATPTVTTAKGPISSFGVPKWLVELADFVDPSGAAVELPETARSATAAPFFAKLEAWSGKFSETRGVSGGSRDEQLLRDFDNICSEFQTLLRLAGLTVDEVHEAFDLLWGSLESSSIKETTRHSSEGHALALHQVGQASTLLSTVIDGVGACHLLQATDYGLDFWRSLFACVAQLPNSHEQAGFVASKVLLATPSTFLAQMADILPSHLCTIFVSSEGGVAQRQAREKSIADALQNVDLNRDGGSSLVQATTEQLLRHFNYNHGHLRAGVQGRGFSAPSHGHAAVSSGASFAASSTSWLFTLAHIPKVRQDCFFQTLSQLQKASADTSTGACDTFRINNLCELLLAQWTSRGYVTQKTVHKYQFFLKKVTAARNSSNERNEHTGDPTLATLALALYQSDHSRPRCVALYLSLLQCLQLLGCDAELVPSVAALVQCRDQRESSTDSGLELELPSPSYYKPLVVPPVAFFESLAWASDDLDIALQMHELYVNSISTRHSLRQQLASSPPSPSSLANREEDTLWSVGFWNKFADRLSAALEQGKLTPGQVSYALDLPARLATLKKGRQFSIARPKKAKYGKYASKKKGLGAPTVALVEKLAVHFALAPNLVPRRALRGVEECRHLLVTHGREQEERQEERLATARPSTALTASPTVLRAIFHLVTRDLDSANHGRTTRLRWFVDIVRREHSEQEAVASGHALERWRNDAARQRRIDAEDERLAIIRELQGAEQTTAW